MDNKFALSSYSRIIKRFQISKYLAIFQHKLTANTKDMNKLLTHHQVMK
jgi:hypothetical protein